MSYPTLREQVQGYSTPFLLEQYVHMRDQYTAEAIKLMEEELARRHIDADQIEEYRKKSLIGEDAGSGNVKVTHLRRDDFVKLDGTFSRNDGFLVRAMFGEEEVPFFADTSMQYSAVPGRENEPQPVTVYVHKDAVEKAKALIAAHFDFADGVYRVKYSGVKERLASFSFYEIQQTEIDTAEITDAHFSQEEKEVLVHYGKKLLAEIDDIEGRDGRIVFNFDNVEGLVDRLSGKDPGLTKADLLTALEILQIYVGDPAFGKTAEGIAEALLGFFLQ
ncbi:MAG TPA: hypothetical protein VLX68_14210 [Chitinivibrionales bacterium]|nr:hypothetical protein [Chitinivibrionales bacterium]